MIQPHIVKFLFFGDRFVIDMLSHRQIALFSAVMNTGGITSAANVLFTSQPTVSRELARLERQLGLQLFDRERGRLRATEEALLLYDEIQRSRIGLERVTTLASELRNHRTGRISICCLPFYAHVLVPAVLERFHRSFPNVEVSVMPLESPYIDADLAAQRFHLGITELDHAPAGTAMALRMQFNEVCIFPPAHSLLSKRVIKAQDLEGLPFISLAPADPYRRLIDAVFERAGVHRRLIIESHTVASICAMVRRGLGVSIINPLAALDAADSGLHWRPFASAIAFSIGVVRPDYRPSSSLVKAFLDAAREVLIEIEVRLKSNGLKARLTLS